MVQTATPLLHAIPTKTPLDLVTEKFFFIFPITPKQMEWLNTIIYKDSTFWINYWSLTHTLLGMIYGILSFKFPTKFTIMRYIILHTIFEIWELWAAGYLTGIRQLVYQELVDIIMDTIFGLIGVYLIRFILSFSR